MTSFILFETLPKFYSEVNLNQGWNGGIGMTRVPSIIS